MSDVEERASSAPLADEARMRWLFEASIALNSELSLAGLLQRVVEAAASLTSARYAALGVIDAGGSGLEQFITYGLDDETRGQIGELPRGRGILGLLIREAAPLRLRDLKEDPRSVAFPPGHPEMHSFLGVPIMLRGTAYGNLYLTERQDGSEFTQEDEELVQLLAAQAAVAIENTRLYESATSWLRRFESLNDVSQALAGEIELPRLLQLIARRLRELIDARLVLVELPIRGGELLRVEAADGVGAAGMVGLTLGRHDSKSGRILDRGRSERVDALLEDPEVDQSAPKQAGATAGLYTPLLVRGKAIGVLVAFDKQGRDRRFTQVDLQLAEAFANRAAVAVDLSGRVAREGVRTLIAGQEAERERLARELHDETGQALTAILLGLKPLEQQLGAEALQPLRELVSSTLDQVRRLAVELRPALLDDFGLVPALERLTEGIRTDGVIVSLESGIGEDSRLPAELETALYRIAQEALTNIARHAKATQVSVELNARDGKAALQIADNGIGFNPAHIDDQRLGLRGIGERVNLLEGAITIDSTPNIGTRIRVELPLTR